VGQVLVPGIYAWAITVVPVASDRLARPTAGVTAMLAFVALVVGTFVVKQRPRLGHALGIWSFVALCLASWLQNLDALQVERLDPIRAAAGTIGWILFALGWGTPWRTGRHPEDDPRAQLHPKLEPRKPPQLRAALAVSIAVVGALAGLLLAWRATDPGRALLLHGASLACAVAVVTTAATVGLAQGKKRVGVPPRQRMTYAFPWLMALVALVVIAIAWVLGT